MKVLIEDFAPKADPFSPCSKFNLVFDFFNQSSLIRCSFRFRFDGNEWPRLGCVFLEQTEQSSSSPCSIYCHCLLLTPVATSVTNPSRQINGPVSIFIPELIHRSPCHGVLQKSLLNFIKRFASFSVIQGYLWSLLRKLVFRRSGARSRYFEM